MECPIVCPSHNSGTVIFNLFKEIAQMTAEHLGEQVKFYKDYFYRPKTKGRVYVPFDSPKSNYGSQPTHALYDELGNHKGPENLESFRSGMGAAKKPFEIFLSNPCSDLSLDFFFDYLEFFRKEAKNKRSEWSVRIYEASPKLKITDKKAWMQADPSLKEGQITSLSYLKTESKLALSSQAKTRQFRRLHLGQHLMDDSSRWIDFSLAKKLKKDTFGYQYLGLDLSTSRDRTCLVAMEFLGEGKGFYYRPFYFLPRAALGKMTGQQLKQTDQGIKDGEIEIAGEDVLDQTKVIKKIEWIIEKSEGVKALWLDPSCGGYRIEDTLKDRITTKPFKFLPRLLSPSYGRIRKTALCGGIALAGWKVF